MKITSNIIFFRRQYVPNYVNSLLTGETTTVTATTAKEGECFNLLCIFSIWYGLLLNTNWWTTYIFHICAVLGNCFDIKLTTAAFGNEYSWSLGTCSSNQEYSDNKEYIEECCLDAGVYTLKCTDYGYDGWYEGSINIQGKTYCDDFYGDYEEAIEVTIVTGKCIFTQGSILGSIKHLFEWLLFNINMVSWSSYILLLLKVQGQRKKRSAQNPGRYIIFWQYVIFTQNYFGNDLL